MKNYINSITKRFLINEANNMDASASIQIVREMLSAVKPSSKKDGNRIKIALEQLGSIRRQVRKLNETINGLEEQLKVLQEKKE